MGAHVDGRPWRGRPGYCSRGTSDSRPRPSPSETAESIVALVSKWPLAPLVIRVLRDISC